MVGSNLILRVYNLGRKNRVLGMGQLLKIPEHGSTATEESGCVWLGDYNQIARINKFK